MHTAVSSLPSGIVAKLALLAALLVSGTCNANDLIHDPATGTYNYEGINDYLADASRLSDNLLPARANLQQVSETSIKPGGQHSVTPDLSANALQLIVLEAERTPPNSEVAF